MANIKTVTVEQETAIAHPRTKRARGWLSRYARRRKLEHFFARIPSDARVLDLGCAGGWVKEWAEEHGYQNVIGIDLEPPADIVGDVNAWSDLGLEGASFDYIVAFEVVEHGDLAESVRQLLKPGGELLATTPVPRLDWACRLLEWLGVLQKRTGPHSHLVDLRHYPGFNVVEWRVKGLLSQWAVLTPAP